MEVNNYFLLFANCQIVKGSKHHIIVDLLHERYKQIPAPVIELIDTLKENRISSVIEGFNTKEKQKTIDFIQYLVDNEWGHLTTKPEFYPDLTKQPFSNPRTLNNAILDLDHTSDYDLCRALKEIDKVGIYAVQIRVYNQIEEKKFLKTLSYTKNLNTKYIQVLIPFTDYLDSQKELEAVLSENLQIREVIISNSNRKEVYYNEESDLGIIRYIEEEIGSCEQCGQISKWSFSPNQQHFLEAQEFNTCLNGKVSVDVDGNIKNCPSMTQSFGKVGSTNIQEVVNTQGFRTLWTINKDQISECQDCEFRYICTDCRAYITDGNDKFSKPAKCAYDPYEGTWKKEKSC